MVYRLVFDTILAALFWMHYNLRRLNLERLLKSELQLEIGRPVDSRCE